MSDHNPGSELDLDAIEARWCEGAWTLATPDIAALVAEVRHLRAQVERLQLTVVEAHRALGQSEKAWARVKELAEDGNYRADMGYRNAASDALLSIAAVLDGPLSPRRPNPKPIQ